MADYTDPPHDIKFVHPHATNTTPIAVLGVKPSEQEFMDMKLKEKNEVILFLVFKESPDFATNLTRDTTSQIIFY